jgi:peptidoglycan hydrolase-like protein with peptidoglycan-binding domain
MALQSSRLSRHPRLQAAAANHPPLHEGDTGGGVETVQQALVDLGFPLPISTRKTGFPDGIYGKETLAAVRAFQAREGVHHDGIAGRDTLHRLDAILLRQQTRDHVQFQAELLAPPPLRKYHGL